jgi:hypothetical protein
MKVVVFVLQLLGIVIDRTMTEALFIPALIFKANAHGLL